MSASRDRMKDSRTHMYDSMMKEETSGYIGANLEDPNINIELEQGRAKSASKM